MTLSFDREARDALRPVPVMLYEHAKGAPDRFHRRHRVYTVEGQQVVVTLKRQWRRPGVMVPATAAQLDAARAAL
jgi:hypothetical protein